MCKVSVTFIPEENWDFSKEEICKSQLVPEYSTYSRGNYDTYIKVLTDWK